MVARRLPQDGGGRNREGRYAGDRSGRKRGRTGARSEERRQRQLRCECHCWASQALVGYRVKC